METKTYNKFYPFQLWLATLTVAPFLNVLVITLVNVDEIGFPLDFSFMLFLGLIFSLPVLFVVLLLFAILIMQQLKPLVIKIVVICVTVLGIFLTFYMFQNTIAWSISNFYSLGAIISGLLLRVEKKIQ